MQQQEKPQDFLNDLSVGVNLALIAIFSVNRSVQIWSRVPGSTGSWFYGWIYFIGLGIQAWYYGANAQALMTYDYIGLLRVTHLSLMWFGVHGVVRNFHFARGLRFHSYEPGTGILDWLFPRWKPQAALLASDITIAIALSSAFWLLASPILSGWYAAVCVWLVVAHLWINASRSKQLQAGYDSQSEARRWSNHFQE